MASDFVDERQGYLSLTEEEYERASQNDSAIPKLARLLLAYDENQEGYWTWEKFMQLLEAPVKIAEIKYPKANRWKTGVVI